jgi:glucan endo-1,3-alpha-glucosidase
VLYKTSLSLIVVTSAVSPWQFKNGPSDAWVELSDTLIKYRWEQAINTVKPDIVEVLTFNDYGECNDKFCL